MTGHVRWHPDGGLQTGLVPIWTEPPRSPTLAVAGIKRSDAGDRYVLAG